MPSSRTHPTGLIKTIVAMAAPARIAYLRFEREGSVAAAIASAAIVRKTARKKSGSASSSIAKNDGAIETSVAASSAATRPNQR